MKTSAVLCTIVTLIFLCQKYQNPFENSTNADIHILAQGTTFSFNDFDTIALFTSETLLVTATVPELIDSFSVTVSKNRLFSNKTITNVSAQHYQFRISPYDTGSQLITIQTYKKDSALIIKNIPFYSRNPLTQKDLLRQNLNDSITLSTKPVGDQDKIWYTWVLDRQVIHSLFPSIKIKVSQMDNREKTGYLYVSDSMFRSPDVTFKFSFYDTIPPSIICINENFDAATNTIFTPDSVFLFRTHVSDGENQPVKKVMDLIVIEIIQPWK